MTTIIASAVLLCVLPGYLLLRVAKGRRPPARSPARRAWLQAVAASLAMSSLAGIVLLELAVFSLPLLCAAMAAVSLALYLIFRPPLRGGEEAPAAAGGAPVWPLALVLASFAAVCLAAGPSEYVFGGWDSGEYVNMGALIAKRGRIVYRDDFFASVPSGDRMNFTQEGRRYMGFNLPDPEGAVVSPKFMHLYPIWLAVAMDLGGLRAALSLNIFFSLVSIALCYRVAALLGGRVAAAAAAFLLAASGVEIWFARTQCAEPLAQLFFLAGVYFWMLWRRGGSPAAPALSALCLGMMALTKIDCLLVVPGLIIALLVSGRGKGTRLFLAIFLAATALLVLHLAGWDRPYARSVLDNVLSPSRGASWVIPAGGAAFVAALVVGVRMRVKRFAVRELPSRARIVSGAAIFAALVLARAVRPALSTSPEAANMAEFAALIGEGLFWFAAAAFVWRWIAGLTRGEELLWLSALGVTAFFAATLAGGLHLYPWSGRRFIPVAIPAAAIFSGCLAARLHSLLPGGWRAAPVVAVAALGLTPLARHPYLVTARDYAGGVEFLERLCRATRGYDIVICEQVKLAVPLDFICGRNVLLFRGDEQTPERCARVERLVSSWLDEGRRVAYVTAGPPVHGATLFFREVRSLDFETTRLPLARHAMPARAGRVRSRITVLEASRTATPRGEGDIVVDISRNCFGLGSGFLGARRIGRKGGVGRWTAPRASLIMPWTGERTPREIVLRLSTGGRRGPVPVDVAVDGKRIGIIRASGGMRDYRVPVPPGTGAGKRRVRLDLSAPPWNPAKEGLEGYPRDLGVFLDRVVVRREDG